MLKMHANQIKICKQKKIKKRFLKEFKVEIKNNIVTLKKAIIIQVDTVQSKMNDPQSSCTMIALPCGLNQECIKNSKNYNHFYLNASGTIQMFLFF